MKAVCTQENFKKAIYSTERVVGKQITLPILENLLIETEGGMLKISATNLEIGVFLKVGAKIEQEGKITIPAKLLSSFVNNLPAESTIALEVESQVLKVSSGGYEASIKGLEAHDFPIIPEMEGEFIFSLSAQELKASLPRLISCVSLDSTRPELTGINLILNDSSISLAATDSFRLGEEEISLKKLGGDEYAALTDKKGSVIVPINTFSEVLRVINPETSEIKVAIEESQIFFQIDNVRIVSRLINGKYPEYRQIIPEQFSSKIILNRDELLRAIKIAGIFTKSGGGEIKIEANPVSGEVSVMSKSEDIGENITKLDSVMEGEKQVAVFNPRYIADGVQAASSPKLALLMNNGTSPAVIRMVEGKENNIIESFTYVIMPIKN